MIIDEARTGDNNRGTLRSKRELELIEAELNKVIEKKKKKKKIK